MRYIVEKDWLSEKLNDKTVRIADCRFNLSSPEEGYKQYVKDHIPGAIYFHLEKDLSGPVKEHGGRHPLPDLELLKKQLEEAGIGHSTTVVAYDGGEGAFASRFWWLLTYLGHENVYVLNGGYKDWKNSGYPVNSEIPSYEKEEFDIEINHRIFASYEEVKNVSDNKQGAILIDSRETKRYLGIEEPIDKKAGHIPGAINKVWMEGFDQGKFKPIPEQVKRFADIDDRNKEIIVYCGSGVTAGPNFMALKEAGYKNVKLYTGSFSDWISYEDNEIETEK